MATTNSSALKCELQVIGATNVETKHKGNLFVRCYLSAGNNRRIQLNTREIVPPSKKNAYLFWDENFSLECNGTEDSVSKLKEEDQNIVFELRWRKPKSFLGKVTGGSQLLAIGEIPWKNIFEAPNMEIQTWVSLAVYLQDDDICNRVLKLQDGANPPALQIAIKVEIPAALSMEETRRRRRAERLRQWDNCGCSSNEGCCYCADTELLFVAAALEAF